MAVSQINNELRWKMDKFCYAELTKATENFKEELGRGTCGAEYKGVLADEGVVAVKKLKIYIKGKMCFRQRNFEPKIADFGLVKAEWTVQQGTSSKDGREWNFLWREDMSELLDITLIYGKGDSNSGARAGHTASN
ncbi:hypothetical protein ACFX15_009375 [Malus domestica]